MSKLKNTMKTLYLFILLQALLSIRIFKTNKVKSKINTEGIGNDAFKLEDTSIKNGLDGDSRKSQQPTQSSPSNVAISSNKEASGVGQKNGFDKLIKNIKNKETNIENIVDYEHVTPAIKQVLSKWCRLLRVSRQG